MAQRTYLVLPTLLLVLVGILLADDSVADNSARGRQQKRNPTRKTDIIDLTDAEKSAAIKFAEKHHPELAELIDELKKTQPAQYLDALWHLHRANLRLEQADQQDERTQLQLAIWKIDSRIKLALARASVLSSKNTKTLEDLLLRRRQKRLELYKLDLARLRARAKEIEATIREFDVDNSFEIKKEAARLINQATKRRATPKGTKPPTKKSPSKTNQSTTQET